MNRRQMMMLSGAALARGGFAQTPQAQQPGPPDGAQDTPNKLPLTGEQELRVTEDPRSVIVSGETFSYNFSKESGLIRAIRVLGQEVTNGTPIPDLIVTEHPNLDDFPYAARHEKHARTTISSAASSRVVIVSEGQYTSEDGKRFPLRYSITYDISIDGVILVSVKNIALDNCSLRWLTLSGGAIGPELAKFVGWTPELSTSRDTRYRFRALSEIPGERILAGTWIPWIWLGDQRVGLEVTTWDVSSQTFIRVNGRDVSDEPDMFIVRRLAEGVRWDNFLVRGARVFAKPGWARSGQFALAVTPSKKFDPYYNMLKGAHIGQRQWSDEQQIRTLAQNGYNLVVVAGFWRSGEYVPRNEAELRRMIELCHRYGVKIIPYMTLVDLNHATEAWREHGEEWAIEPITEWASMPRRNDPEQETTLMCPGAEGWRAFWEQQMDRVIRDYDFDGIYFDFWYERMACENWRHGCGGRFRKATILGSREMLVYAYNRLKAKNPHAIIKANTNLLASALLTSLVDIRLVGESTDATNMDPSSRQWLYTSYRLGETTEFLWANTQWNTEQRASFATLINFLPQYYGGPLVEPRKAFDDFDVFRSFSGGNGAWYLGISGQERLKVSPPEVVTNVVEYGGAMLATLINTRQSPVVAEVPLGRGWLACEPLAERLLNSTEDFSKIELGGGASRHIILAQKPAGLRLLYALGAQKPATETLDNSGRRLVLAVEAADGALIRFGVYSPEPIKKITNGLGEKVPFEWTPETKMARFEVRHMPGVKLEVTF
jgi:hypothetical protein